jgi:hypothetical protein
VANDSRVLDDAQLLVEHRVLVGLVEIPFLAFGVGPGRARRRSPEHLGVGQIFQRDVLDITGRKMLGLGEVQAVDL